MVGAAAAGRPVHSPVMIVAPGTEGELIVVSQHDHARFAGELLSLWRADGLPENPRRDDLLFATRHHDTGWREADSAPRADPGTGRPLDFTEVPWDVRVDVWLRGTARYAGDRPYAALLLTRHALELHKDHRGDERWDEELLDPLDERYVDLLEETGAAPDDVDHDYRFLAFADLLSLTACARWAEPDHGPAERWGRRFTFRPEGGAGERPVDGELTLDPFPLAGATTFRVSCRRIPDRRYRGDADLGVELATARWERLRLRLRPPSADAGSAAGESA